MILLFNLVLGFVYSQDSGVPGCNFFQFVTDCHEQKVNGEFCYWDSINFECISSPVESVDLLCGEYGVAPFCNLQSECGWDCQNHVCVAQDNVPQTCGKQVSAPRQFSQNGGSNPFARFSQLINAQGFVPGVMPDCEFYTTQQTCAGKMHGAEEQCYWSYSKNECIGGEPNDPEHICDGIRSKQQCDAHRPMCFFVMGRCVQRSDAGDFGEFPFPFPPSYHGRNSYQPLTPSPQGPVQPEQPDVVEGSTDAPVTDQSATDTGSETATEQPAAPTQPARQRPSFPYPFMPPNPDCEEHRFVGNCVGSFHEGQQCYWDAMNGKCIGGEPGDMEHICGQSIRRQSCHAPCVWAGFRCVQFSDAGDFGPFMMPPMGDFAKQIPSNLPHQIPSQFQDFTDQIPQNIPPNYQNFIPPMFNPFGFMPPFFPTLQKVHNPNVPLHAKTNNPYYDNPSWYFPNYILSQTAPEGNPTTVDSAAAASGASPQLPLGKRCEGLTQEMCYGPSSEGLNRVCLFDFKEFRCKDMNPLDPEDWCVQFNEPDGCNSEDACCWTYEGHCSKNDFEDCPALNPMIPMMIPSAPLSPVAPAAATPAEPAAENSATSSTSSNVSGETTVVNSGSTSQASNPSAPSTGFVEPPNPFSDLPLIQPNPPAAERELTPDCTALTMQGETVCNSKAQMNGRLCAWDVRERKCADVQFRYGNLCQTVSDADTCNGYRDCCWDVEQYCDEFDGGDCGRPGFMLPASPVAPLPANPMMFPDFEYPEFEQPEFGEAPEFGEYPGVNPSGMMNEAMQEAAEEQRETAEEIAGFPLVNSCDGLSPCFGRVGNAICYTNPATGQCQQLGGLRLQKTHHARQQGTSTDGIEGVPMPEESTQAVGDTGVDAPANTADASGNSNQGDWHRRMLPPQQCEDRHPSACSGPARKPGYVCMISYEEGKVSCREALAHDREAICEQFQEPTGCHSANCCWSEGTCSSEVEDCMRPMMPPQGMRPPPSNPFMPAANCADYTNPRMCFRDRMGQRCLWTIGEGCKSLHEVEMGEMCPYLYTLNTCQTNPACAWTGDACVRASSSTSASESSSAESEFGPTNSEASTADASATDDASSNADTSATDTSASATSDAASGASQEASSTSENDAYCAQYTRAACDRRPSCIVLEGFCVSIYSYVEENPELESQMEEMCNEYTEAFCDQHEGCSWNGAECAFVESEATGENAPADASADSGSSEPSATDASSVDSTSESSVDTTVADVSSEEAATSDASSSADSTAADSSASSTDPESSATGANGVDTTPESAVSEESSVSGSEQTGAENSDTTSDGASSESADSSSSTVVTVDTSSSTETSPDASSSTETSTDASSSTEASTGASSSTETSADGSSSPETSTDASSSTEISSSSDVVIDTSASDAYSPSEPVPSDSQQPAESGTGSPFVQSCENLPLSQCVGAKESPMKVCIVDARKFQCTGAKLDTPGDFCIQYDRNECGSHAQCCVDIEDGKCSKYDMEDCGIYNYAGAMPGFNAGLRLRSVHACSHFDSVKSCMRQRTHSGATCMWHAATGICREGSLSSVHDVCGAYTHSHLCQANLQCSWARDQCIASSRKLNRGHLVIDCTQMQSRISCTGATVSGEICMWNAADNSCFPGNDTPEHTCAQWGIQAECENLTECDWDTSCKEAASMVPASSNGDGVPSGETGSTEVSEGVDATGLASQTDASASIREVDAADSPSEPEASDRPIEAPDSTTSNDAATEIAPPASDTPSTPETPSSNPFSPAFGPITGKCQFNPTKGTCVGSFDREDGKPCFWHACRQFCFSGEIGDVEDMCPTMSSARECNANPMCIYMMGCCMQRDPTRTSNTGDLPFDGMPPPQFPPPPFSGRGSSPSQGGDFFPPPHSAGRRPNFDPLPPSSGPFNPSGGSGRFAPPRGGPNFPPFPAGPTVVDPTIVDPMGPGSFNPFSSGPGYHPEFERPEFEAPEGPEGGFPGMGMPGSDMMMPPPGVPPVSFDISCEALPEMGCVGQPKEGKMNEICVWLPGKSHGMGKCKSCQRADPKCMCQRFGHPNQCETDNFCGWSLKDNICIDKVNAAKDNAPPEPSSPNIIHSLLPIMHNIPGMAEMLPPRGPHRPPSPSSSGENEPSEPAQPTASFGPPGASNVNAGFSEVPSNLNGKLKHALCRRQVDQASCEKLEACTWSEAKNLQSACKYSGGVKLQHYHHLSKETSSYNFYFLAAISFFSALFSFGAVVLFFSTKKEKKEHEIGLIKEESTS